VRNGDDGVRMKTSDGRQLDRMRATCVTPNDGHADNGHAAGEAAVAVAVIVFAGMLLRRIAGNLGVGIGVHMPGMGRVFVRAKNARRERRQRGREGDTQRQQIPE